MRSFFCVKYLLFFVVCGKIVVYDAKDERSNRMQFFFNYIFPPLVGAVIGYFTNFLAIKMMFHPYKPVKIGKWRLPFTPGIIPKRKPYIAKALASAVGNNLVTKEDLKKVLLSEESKHAVCTAITHAILDNEESFENQLKHQLGEERYAEVTEKTCKKISAVVADGLMKLDINGIVIEKGGELAEKYITNPLVAMFLTKDKVNSILGSIADQMVAYLQEHSDDLFLSTIEEKVGVLAQKNVDTMLAICGFEKETVQKLMESAYDKLISDKSDALLEQIKITEIIEEKVNSMSNQELEKFTLSVMKRELNAVINLGAVIGLILGLVNIIPF